MSPTEWLELGAVQWLRELDDDDFDALVVRARGPRRDIRPRGRGKRRGASEGIR